MNGSMKMDADGIGILCKSLAWNLDGYRRDIERGERFDPMQIEVAAAHYARTLAIWQEALRFEAIEQAETAVVAVAA